MVEYYRDSAGRPILHFLEGASTPLQKCAKNSKGCPLRIFCKFLRMGRGPSPDFVPNFHGAGGGRKGGPWGAKKEIAIT